MSFHCVCVCSHAIVSDSVQPFGLVACRLLCPWDSTGKNTGVSWSFYYVSIILFYSLKQLQLSIILVDVTDILKNGYYSLVPFDRVVRLSNLPKFIDNTLNEQCYWYFSNSLLGSFLLMSALIYHCIAKYQKLLAHSKHLLSHTVSLGQQLGSGFVSQVVLA